MKKSRTHRDLRFLKSDDASSQVPVSKHVLNLRKITKRLQQQSNPKQSNRWQPSAVQQMASLALTLVLCASSFGITYGNPLSTLSYFRDVENSTDNQFAAGLLAFRLNPGDVTVPIHEGDIVTLSPLFTPDPETFEIKYRVRAKVIGTHTPLCSLLNASGTSLPYIYDGLLADLLTKPATTTGHGTLKVSLPNAAGVADGTKCTVALVYDGWYIDAPENTGYTDSKQDTFTFVYDAPDEETAPASEESGISETSDSATTTQKTKIKDRPETPSVSPVVKKKIVTEDATSTPPAETKPTSTYTQQTDFDLSNASSAPPAQEPTLPTKDASTTQEVAE